jgi:hypothetical protein
VLAVHGRAVRGRSGRGRRRRNVARALGIGLSTETRRWQPAEALGRRGARARGHQGRGLGAGKEGGDAWRSSQQEVALRRR